MTDRERLDRIFDEIYRVVGAFAVEAWKTAEPVPFAEKTCGEALGALHPGERWGKDWDCAWMKLTAKLPDNQAGDLALLLDVGGEACLFDERGKALKGFTNVQSEFTVALGRPGKVCMFLPEAPAREVTFWADCGANDLFGAKPENGVFVRAEFARCDLEKRGLYYDLDVLLSVAETGSAEAKRLFDEAISEPDVAAARKKISAFLQNGEQAAQTVFAIGNAHIDLAWLWPMRETRRKAVRTLATACYLLERYPEYRFSVSQPQMMEWVKEDAPELYERVCEWMRAGRIELLGGMWVEPDVNLPTGESLARQLLYGIDESERVFGEKQTVLCLPDSFGFCGQLPQLIKSAGLSGFLTTKLSWNGVNRFPYKSFRWKGIDGSEVVSHIPPEGNYNSGAWPASVLKAKGDKADPSALLYGIGDGGGGPGMEHLERVAREKQLPGFPKVQNGSVREFFEALKQREKDLPVWQGELYLEKHQGVYTTFGELKAAMAECERGLFEAEFYAALAVRTVWRSEDEAARKEQIGRYRETIGRLWKGVLLLQFHDILPGTCMQRAMKENLAACEKLRREIFAYAKELRGLLTVPSEEEYVWNCKPCGEGSLTVAPPEERKERLCTRQGERFLENKYFRVEFTETGAIEQITALDSGETFLRAPAELRFYEDRENAWEIPDVKAAPYTVPAWECVSREGTDRVFKQKNAENGTELTVRLFGDRPRIDFLVNWRNFPPHTLAKWVFPLKHQSEFARCGIPFGEILRPTTARNSYDSAMKEVPFLQYVDISDDLCGAAVLSSQLHGVSLRDCEPGVSLRRSPDYPASSGREDAATRFSFLPHAVGADLLSEAADAAAVSRAEKGTPVIAGKILDVSPLVVSCFKPAEREDGAIVLRCYNPKNAFVKARILPASALGITKISRVDLREENPAELCGGVIEASPFEIVTLLLR